MTINDNVIIKYTHYCLFMYMAIVVILYVAKYINFDNKLNSSLRGDTSNKYNHQMYCYLS
jgi:hypothetical protein